jgi:protein SCO1/2
VRIPFSESASRKRLAAWSLAAAAGVMLAAYGAQRLLSAHDHPAPSLAALDQSLVKVEGSKALQNVSLVGMDGSPLTQSALQGRWSLVFFGFTSCPDVCPATLQTLSTVAANPASGVLDGSTQLLFVSIDPQRDTPERMRQYLGNFDARIKGATGTEDALAVFSAQAGAGFSATAAGFDHSTSLFVFDPEARLAGVLLNPSNVARIVADLDTLRQSRGLYR